MSRQYHDTPWRDDGKEFWAPGFGSKALCYGWLSFHLAAGGCAPSTSRRLDSTEPTRDMATTS